MEKNDVFEIEITGMTDDGDGVGRAEGMAVFVPYTIIGETVRVHIIKVNKSYAIGKLLEVIRPSESRIKAECEYFYKCGGCQLWHMDYDAELKFKQKKVEDCIRRIGGIDAEILPIISAEETYRYRNKVQMPVSDAGIGFYKKNSHNVIDMEDCLLQTKLSDKIVSIVRQWMKEWNVSPYNEESGKGTVRNIFTRVANKETLVVIVTSERKVQNIDKLTERLKEADGSIVGVVQNINQSKTNKVLGSENILLWGREYVVDNIGEVCFEISPNSFYQVNNAQTYKLYSVAKEMANLTGGETLWDLYCGIGTIGQFMADKVQKIVGIEIVPQAVEDAKRNAKRNNILNTEYYCGAAENIAPELLKKGYSADVVVLDPPRKGCDEKLLSTVASLKPKKIIYISCKPSTLARDLKYLKGKGYMTEKIVPVDMFPRTSHVECCALICQE